MSSLRSASSRSSSGLAALASSASCSSHQRIGQQAVNDKRSSSYFSTSAAESSAAGEFATTEEEDICDSESLTQFSLDSAKSKRTNAKFSTTTHTTTTSATRSSTILLAIVEGRGKAKGEIGLASIDLRHTELRISQFSDATSYNRLRIKLQILKPREIILPDVACVKNGNMELLFQLLQTEFPHIGLNTVHRKHFNESAGLEMIRNLIVAECSSAEKDYVSKYYGLAAARAVVKYAEFVENTVFAARSLKVTFSGLDKSCCIDPTTAKNLELLVCGTNIADTSHSLYGVLNHCHTSAGSRMLRSSILEPTNEVSAIVQRLDAIDDCFANVDNFQSLKSLVRRMFDVNRLVALCARIDRFETPKTCDYKLAELIYLKQTLGLREELRSCLKGFKSDLLKAFFTDLGDERYGDIMAKICSVMCEGAHVGTGTLGMRVQKCFAIKPGINGLLDVQRRTYNELMDDICELVHQVCEDTQLPFRNTYTASRGFHLLLHIHEGLKIPDTLPGHLINVVRSRTSLICTTQELRIVCTPFRIVVDLLNHIREHIVCLYKLADCIATLDLIVSLTEAANLGKYVRPDFDNDMVVTKGRHPILDKFCDESVVANDIQALDSKKFVILTGPNMAGKSTYLKQVALLQIMAQAGSYVPADKAWFPICNKIFSRIGHNDDFESSSSSFMMEMKDMNYVMRDAASGTLVIIDELGRATEPNEGLAVCWAICEDLLERKAFVFIATHFLDLTALDSMYLGIANYHFKPQTKKIGRNADEVVCLNHRIYEGAYSGPTYGFEIAEASKFPKTVIERAHEISAHILATRSVSVMQDPQYKRNRVIHSLGSWMIQLAKMARDQPKGTNSAILREQLLEIRARYAAEMSKPLPTQQTEEVSSSGGSEALGDNSSQCQSVPGVQQSQACNSKPGPS